MLRKYKLQLRLQNLCSADMYKKSPKYTAQVVNTLQVQNYTKSCKTLAPKYTAVRTIKYCKRQTLQVPTNPEYSQKIVQNTICRQMLQKYKLQLRLQNLCSAEMYKKLQIPAPKYTAVKTIKYYK